MSEDSPQVVQFAGAVRRRVSIDRSPAANTSTAAGPVLTGGRRFLRSMATTPEVKVCAVTFPDTFLLEDKHQFHPTPPHIPGGTATTWILQPSSRARTNEAGRWSLQGRPTEGPQWCH